MVTVFLTKEAEHLFLFEPCGSPLHRPFVANTAFFADVWLALPCLGIRKGVRLVRLTNGFLSGQPMQPVQVSKAANCPTCACHSPLGLELPHGYPLRELPGFCDPFMRLILGICLWETQSLG